MTTYEKLPENTRHAVVGAFTEAKRTLTLYGHYTANDERADALIEAIAGYLVASGAVVEGGR